jgi:hypothetical protein
MTHQNLERSPDGSTSQQINHVVHVDNTLR